jgi:hypothetical protein
LRRPIGPLDLPAQAAARRPWNEAVTQLSRNDAGLRAILSENAWWNRYFSRVHREAIPQRIGLLTRIATALLDRWAARGGAAFLADDHCSGETQDAPDPATSWLTLKKSYFSHGLSFA